MNTIVAFLTVFRIKLEYFVLAVMLIDWIEHHYLCSYNNSPTSPSPNRVVFKNNFWKHFASISRREEAPNAKFVDFTRYSTICPAIQSAQLFGGSSYRIQSGWWRLEGTRDTPQLSDERMAE
ncbi:hypothetical protein DICVIV_13555 [Dictyocaulus viviparus]|uniref:Uncharacterized protein n=1 Tax=Dictyocaulus viviparus TaxID=29172 RepID=A0A0D8XA28_DICVI|nr:hypothetical protein DICVIV_13555 [Dictyocaulus viviparus]